MSSKPLGKITLFGGVLLLAVCLLWGGNMVSIKISNRGVPPLLAATIRSLAASLLVFLLARSKGQRVLLGRADFKHGLVIGLLFGLDFLFLYWGTLYTYASRAVIFLYTHPFWVALGAHFVLKDDRLNASKVTGLFLAFGGILMVFNARPQALGRAHWLGDLMLVAAALFWAATTLYIKRTMAGRGVSHYQTLFAQLFYSIPILGLGWFLMERGQVVTITGSVAFALAYQTLVVAFLSYVLWFWMIHTFPVSRLTAFTFLTPMFGVILSGLILGEPLPAVLWVGLALVAGGIYLVNR